MHFSGPEKCIWLWVSDNGKVGVCRFGGIYSSIGFLHRKTVETQEYSRRLKVAFGWNPKNGPAEGHMPKCILRG